MNDGTGALTRKRRLSVRECAELSSVAVVPLRDSIRRQQGFPPPNVVFRDFCLKANPSADGTALLKRQKTPDNRQFLAKISVKSFKHHSLPSDAARCTPALSFILRFLRPRCSSQFVLRGCLRVWRKDKRHCRFLWRILSR